MVVVCDDPWNFFQKKGCDGGTGLLLRIIVMALIRSFMLWQIKLFMEGNDKFTSISNKKRPPSCDERPFKVWCELGSNQRHKDFQSFALPTELSHLLPFILLNVPSVGDCKCSFFFLLTKSFYKLFQPTPLNT